MKKNTINKKDYLSIKKLRVVNLATFGHNGVDWMHSLLDGHPDILIMPAFSFYRSLHRLRFRDEKFKNIKKITFKEISKEITKQFYFEKMYQTQRRKFIFSLKQKKEFEISLYSYLIYSKNKKKNFEKNIFFGIHHAFCKIHKININNKKIIVIQEHVPWHSFKYEKTFNSKFIYIMRDPRAALAGAFVRFRKHFKKEMNPLQFDYSLFYWNYAISFYKSLIAKKTSKKMIVIKNEDMHNNLKKTQKNLCKFLKIDFNKTLLNSTFMKKKWFGESSYLQDNQEKDLIKSPHKSFYENKNIEKRWRNTLDKNEILIIEILYKFIFDKFHYLPDNKRNLKGISFTYYYLFTNYIFENKNFLKTFKNIVRRFFVLFLPTKVTSFFNSFR
jgi:hypothetical protein